MRSGQTFGLGDRPEYEGGERAYADAAWWVISRSMPDDGWFDRFSESDLGSPPKFALGGRELSGGAIVNGLTASRIAHWCERTGIASRPLRVLEIGAGYGQVAHQLIQALEVESYAVCDLPQNLLLGSFYLQGTFPEREAAFLDHGGDAAGAGLVFSAPPFLERLEGPFDLVLNSYSFQEMNRESVDEYFEHAARTLAPDGVFYSLNAHGKAGIERPSQYPIEAFELESLAPVRRFPFQIFATNPYELVMRPRRGELAAEVTEQRGRSLDALGSALQFGFHDELLPLCEAVSAGELSSSDLEAIEALRDFAYGADAAAMREALGRLEGLETVRLPLLGSLEFAIGDNEPAEQTLRKVLPSQPETHARLRSHLALAALAHRRADSGAAADQKAAAGELAPHLSGEFRTLAPVPESCAALFAAQLNQ